MTACNLRQRLKAAGCVEMYKQRVVLLHLECPRKAKLVFIHYSLDVRNCLLSVVRYGLSFTQTLLYLLDTSSNTGFENQLIAVLSHFLAM